MLRLQVFPRSRAPPHLSWCLPSRTSVDQLNRGIKRRITLLQLQKHARSRPHCIVHVRLLLNLSLLRPDLVVDDATCFIADLATTICDILNADMLDDDISRALSELLSLRSSCSVISAALSGLNASLTQMALSIDQQPSQHILASQDSFLTNSQSSHAPSRCSLSR